VVYRHARELRDAPRLQRDGRARAEGDFLDRQRGQGLGRLQAATNVALAPAIGPGGGFTMPRRRGRELRALPRREARCPFCTRRVSFSGSLRRGKMALVVSNGGQSDIFVGARMARVCRRRPAAGSIRTPLSAPPGSSRTSRIRGEIPDLHRREAGELAAGRTTWRRRGERSGGTKILFMGRDGATWTSFSVDPGGSAGSMKRSPRTRDRTRIPRAVRMVGWWRFSRPAADFFQAMSMA